MNTNFLNKLKARKKDLLFYSLFGLVGLLILFVSYKLFSRFDKEEEKGLQVEIQAPEVESLPSNKIEAYIQGTNEMVTAQQDSLQLSYEEYRDSLDHHEGLKQDDSSVVSKENVLISTDQKARSLHAMADGYSRDWQRSEEEYSLRRQLEQAEQEKLMLQEELKRKQSIDSQLDYLRELQQGDHLKSAESVVADSSAQEEDLRAAIPHSVATASESCSVSTLDRSSYGSAQGDSRSHGFLSGTTRTKGVPRNTISCVVDKTVTIAAGDYVPLRLTEPIVVEGIVLPRHTVLIAKSTFSGGRLDLRISTIHYQGRIFRVSLQAFDVDGQEGLFVPESVGSSVLSEVTQSVADAPTSRSVTISRSAKDNLLSDLARGAIRGISSVFSHKAQQVKITLKSGYRLYLVTDR